MNKPPPKAAKGTTHKAPRVAKAAASAKMAGFESIGHQAATTFKQLNSAAMLSLAQDREAEHIKPVFFVSRGFSLDRPNLCARPLPRPRAGCNLAHGCPKAVVNAWVSVCCRLDKARGYYTS